MNSPVPIWASLYQLTSNDNLIEKITDQLPGCKAMLMSQSGILSRWRRSQPQIPIYQMIVMDLPPWAIRAIGKIRRGFLWRGSKEANGGHCLVAWVRLGRPLESCTGPYIWDGSGCGRRGRIRCGRNARQHLSPLLKISTISADPILYSERNGGCKGREL